MVTGKQSPLSSGTRRISYAELKRHYSYDDAWVAINGQVYDITAFIPSHPFGDTFRGSLGSDCSGLFSASHAATAVEQQLKNPSFLAANGIRLVGQLDVSGDRLFKGNQGQYLDRLVYRNSDDDPFWLDLRDRVNSYIKESGQTTHYTRHEGILYLIYYSFIFLILAYLAWIQASIVAALLLGIHLICASTNMAHMATHFGFTRIAALDFIAAHFFDLCGLSCLEWQIIHQTHHHQPHSCIDYQTNQYAPIRIHPYVRHRTHHRYQHIYFWLAIATYHIRTLVTSSLWLLQHHHLVRHRREYVAHTIARLILFSCIVACGQLHGLVSALLIFTSYSLACSYSAFLLLFNDHEDTHKVLAHSADINSVHHQLSWAETQVRTSGNWQPRNWVLKFIEFHYGYFNYHIEHHLFPAFKPSLLKRLSPIVRQVCADHGIPYISTSFMAMQRSFQRHLTTMAAQAAGVAEEHDSHAATSFP